MKGKLFLLVITFAMFLGCKSQERVIKNISCDSTVIIQYDKVRNDDKGKPIANKDLNSFTVYFISTYNDEIVADVNRKVIFEKQVIRDANAHDLNDYFIYDYSKDNEVPILKVSSKTDNSCFDIQVDKKYKLIYVFKSDEKWTVRYSNIYYIN